MTRPAGGARPPSDGRHMVLSGRVIEWRAMGFVRPPLVVIACLLLAAHVLRLGSLVAAAGLAALPLLLLVRRNWALRALQVALVLGVAEWLRTLVQLVGARRAAGVPAGRLAVILLAVTLITSAAALVLSGRRRPSPAGSAPSAEGMP